MNLKVICLLPLLLLIGSCKHEGRPSTKSLELEAEKKDTIYSAMLAPLVIFDEVRKQRQRLEYNVSRLEFLGQASVANVHMKFPKQAYNFSLRQYASERDKWMASLEDFDLRVEAIQLRIEALTRSTTCHPDVVKRLKNRKIQLDTLLNQAKDFNLDDPFVTKEELEYYSNY